MKIQSINPSTGELIEEFEENTPDEVKTSVAKAKLAQKQWQKTSLAHRHTIFLKLSELLKKNTEEILKLIKDETGKRIPDGQAELADVIDAIDYYYEQIQKVKGLELDMSPELFPKSKMYVEYVPHGTVGLLMPWNFPFYVPMMYLIPLLYAGNAVVLKPSEYATLVSRRIKKLFDEAGFPKDLIQLVIGADEVGKTLVKSDIDKIFLVGSILTGKDVLKNIGLKPAQMELGGNSAAIILEDANIELAAQGTAWSGTYNAGQECVGIKRVFVFEKVAKDLITSLVDIVSNLKPERDYGPYIHQEALEAVEKRVNDAVKSGAKLLCGCKRLSGTEFKGFWLTPSVIQFEDDSLDLVKYETFGNTVPVSIVNTEEELLRRVNGTNYGLSNCIFSKNIEPARMLAEKIESGMVFINDPFLTYRGWDHWTGWKESGIETTESKIMQCLKKKVVTVNKSLVKRAYWYPYPE